MTIHLMARQKLDELLSQTNHSLTLDDIPLVLKLNEAALKVVDPYDDEGLQLQTLPVKVGQYLLARPHISKERWYNHVIEEWDNPPDLLLPFILWTEVTGEYLWSTPDRKDVERRIRKFGNGLHTTRTELEGALKHLLPQLSDVPESASGEGYGPLISTLIREYGQTAEYWLNEAHPDLISMLITEHSRNIDQLNEEHAKAMRGSGKAVRPPRTPKSDALEAFRNISNEIIASWQ